MIKAAKVKKILVMRNDRFGEFLLIIPALRALKETFPHARLSLMVAPAVKSLADCVEYIDKIFTWENKKHNLRDVLGFAKQLKEQEFDLCVIFNPNKELHILSFLSRIPVRVGYGRKWGFLLTHKIKDSKAFGLKHEVEYNLDLVSLIGAKTNDKSISLSKLPATEHIIYAGYIAVHPYTSDMLKQWPIERFIELAQRLARELGLKVVIVGLVPAGVDPNKGRTTGIENFESPGENIINMVNKSSLVGLAALLKRCRLLISGDSGPVHLAAAVGTPVVALFRNDLAGKTAKRWGPWGEGHVVIEQSSLNDISVVEVFNKIKEKLKDQFPGFVNGF